MVLRLAGFLRSALESGRRELVTLKEELALARDYLEIERVRFGDRLSVSVTADAEALNCAVPPLIIQPLVENAVKHGIAHAVEGGTISLEVLRSGGRLVCRVRNPAENDRPRGAGLGLANVRQRLERLFGRESMVTVAEEPGRFLVELSLPAREMPG
jgi:LytS/YehU family sensor histidine kinase